MPLLMKTTNNLRGKTLFSSSAAILLGLISINPRLVKADSDLTSQTAPQEGGTTDEIPTPSEDAINDDTNTGEPTSAQDSVANQATETDIGKKRIDGTAAGLQVSYDLDTDELTILGGTYTNITNYNDRISNYTLSNNEGNSIKLKRAKQIIITGKINLDDANNANFLFDGFSYASKIVGLEYLDLSQATSTAFMFRNCQNLLSLDISSFNTANVTNMGAMFANCSNLDCLDVSAFNTAKVTNMDRMFDSCSNLISLDLSNFDTANVESMYEIFLDCSSLTSLNLSSFNTANVTTMEFMFSGCSALPTLNLSSFNTANVTTMEYMFNGCTALTALDLSNFNTAKVTSMGGMFSGNESLVDLNISSFDTSSLYVLYEMFMNCKSLTELNLEHFHIPDIDESDFSLTFYGCTNLRKLNIKNIATGAPEYILMLAGLPNLNTLVLGKDTDLTTVYGGDIDDIDSIPPGYLDDVGLDTEGIWLNVGKGTTTHPEGTEQFTSEQLMKSRAITLDGKKRNFTKGETYVRMGLPITIHHVDESGKKIGENTIFPGNLGDPYSIIGDCTNLRKLNIKNIATGAPEYILMLAGLPNLNTLVLGKDTDLTTVYGGDIDDIDSIPPGYLDDVGLDTEGIWLNVGKGTTTHPEGTEQFTSEQLMKSRAITLDGKKRNFTKGETYVRMGLPITIHHVDESGKKIGENTIFPGNLGDPYSIIGDYVAGYTLKAGQSPITGIYDNDEDREREFTFIYIKNPESSAPIKGEDVTVHYQDENGKAIASSEVLSGNLNDGYVSTAKEIAGYTLKSRPKNATGFFSNTKQSIIYIYSKNASPTESETTGSPAKPTNTDKEIGNIHQGNSQIANEANNSQAAALTSSPSNNADNLNSANSSIDDQLPKTGSEKKSQLTTIALGSITLTSALVLAWARNKKSDK